MTGNAIYHVLKIIHKDVFTLYIYDSDLESVHLQLFFLFKCHVQRHDNVLYDRLKQKQTKSLCIYFNLKLFIVLFARYVIFVEKKIYLILSFNWTYCMNKFQIFRMQRA